MRSKGGIWARPLPGSGQAEGTPRPTHQPLTLVPAGEAGSHGNQLCHSASWSPVSLTYEEGLIKPAFGVPGGLRTM